MFPIPYLAISGMCTVKSVRCLLKFELWRKKPRIDCHKLFYNSKLFLYYQKLIECSIRSSLVHKCTVLKKIKKSNFMKGHQVNYIDAS